MANKFHTCSLRSIFAQVHAPVENGFEFIRRYGGELCEALFWQSEHRRSGFTAAVLFILQFFLPLPSERLGILLR